MNEKTVVKLTTICLRISLIIGLVFAVAILLNMQWVPQTFTKFHTVQAHAQASQNAGQITGVVTNADNGQPAENGVVILYDANDEETELEFLDTSGHYLFQTVPPGQYKLGFSPAVNGFLTEFYDNQPNQELATLITVGPNETVTVNAELGRGGTISGIVTGDNAPLGFVGVGLINADGRVIMNTYTDDDGHYRFEVLPPGHYRVGFSQQSSPAPQEFLTEFYDNKPDRETATPIIIMGNEVVTVNADLERGGQIQGVLTGGNTTLADISVQLYDADGKTIKREKTNADGFYQLQTLSPGEYRLQFMPPTLRDNVFLPEYYHNKPDLKSATRIMLTGRESITVNADLIQGGLLEGIVTGGGIPLSNISVVLFDEADHGAVTAITDMNGQYQMQPIPPGRYRIGFEPRKVNGRSSPFFQQFHNNQFDLALATPLIIGAGETKTVNADLIPGGAIEGTIFGKDRPLTDIIVMVFDENAVQLDTTYTDVDGHYQIQPLHPGQYTILFSPSKHGASNEFIPEYYDDKSDRDTATFVPILADETITINTELTRGGTILGTVLGEKTPLENIIIRLYDRDGAEVESTYTDAEGHYLFSALPANEYRLRFEPPRRGSSSGFLPEFHTNQSTLALATPIPLAIDETVTINAELLRNMVIEETP
ncbi:MAG: carboxypeptidase regulatory-like domain-containing protein [Caldilineaceae bacterium]